MHWLSIVVDVNLATVERICEFFEPFVPLAITLQPFSGEHIAVSISPVSGEEPIWSQTTITALFPDTIDQRHIVQQLKHSFGLKASVIRIHDQNWLEKSLQKKEPVFCSERLTVVPSWSDVIPDNALIIDPTLAFGSGEHPTTAMCLDWLSQHDLNGKTVIDIGCGSGILALAALKMGAKVAYAVDIDEVALQTAINNARLNNLDHKLHTVSATAFFVDVDLYPKADVIVVNILLNVLKELSSSMVRMMHAQSMVVMSGLLNNQEEACIKHYAHTISFAEPHTKEGWTLLYGHRKHNNPL